MAKESRTKFVILGLLSSGAETGYEIKTAIEKSISYFWSESYGQIYPALKKLTEAGLIKETQKETEGKRDKKRYTITPEGTAALESWIVAKTEDPSHREEMLLKLFLCGNLDAGAAKKILDDHLENYSGKLIELQAIEIMLNELVHPAKEYWLATLRFGIGACQHRINWTNETIENFKKAHIL